MPEDTQAPQGQPAPAPAEPAPPPAAPAPEPAPPPSPAVQAEPSVMVYNDNPAATAQLSEFSKAHVPENTYPPARQSSDE